MAEIVGQVRGIEVLEPQIDEYEAAPAQVSRDHCLRNDRRGLCRADRGREQEVLVEPAR